MLCQIPPVSAQGVQSTVFQLPVHLPVLKEGLEEVQVVARSVSTQGGQEELRNIKFNRILARSPQIPQSFLFENKSFVNFFRETFVLQ